MSKKRKAESKKQKASSSELDNACVLDANYTMRGSSGSFQSVVVME